MCFKYNYNLYFKIIFVIHCWIENCFSYFLAVLANSLPDGTMNPLITYLSKRTTSNDFKLYWGLTLFKLFELEVESALFLLVSSFMMIFRTLHARNVYTCRGCVQL